MNNNLFFRLWGVPILLGLVTLAGLIIALVRDGFWDILSSFLMAIPLAIIGYCLGRMGREKGK
ncbi:hypothetical protein J2X69_003818 [Algoriphagus sp. 4150]|uniref:hypothetical protein n=1 Tax=Algoriphagus sp. 4150 TaxID=2817756 RepID=UPI002865A168|nr:hypothetical protein [Algoriphagus sp. 4150]MDR7131454.1 hypothetical protein [Algoriphagus sp. 4150]